MSKNRLIIISKTFYQWLTNLFGNNFRLLSAYISGILESFWLMSVSAVLTHSIGLLASGPRALDKTNFFAI